MIGRWRNPDAYDQMVLRWERDLGGGVAPIPEWVDEELGALRLAAALRVAPWELGRVPHRWLRAARVQLAIDDALAREAEAARGAMDAASRTRPGVG